MGLEYSSYMERPIQNVSRAELFKGRVENTLNSVKNYGTGFKDGLKVGSTITLFIAGTALHERRHRPNPILQSDVLRKDWRRLNEMLKKAKDPAEVAQHSTSIGKVNDLLAQLYLRGREERDRYRKFHRDE